MYLGISLPRELSGLEVISIFREGNFSSELKKIGWEKKIRIVSTEVIPGCLMEIPRTLQIYLKKDSKLERGKSITFLIDTDESYTQLLPFYDENLTLKKLKLLKQR
ncbi:MAG: hypothetical protein DRN07_07875 [Thermoplasmata archaeon]|nr:MAG: hypothetical protein DRN07_07875 [Thermoplasmata archaeon]